jgi:hypothetical protein
MEADQSYIDAGREQDISLADHLCLYGVPSEMLTAYFAKAILLKAMLSCLRLGVTGPTPTRGLARVFPERAVTDDRSGHGHFPSCHRIQSVS